MKSSIFRPSCLSVIVLLAVGTMGCGGGKKNAVNSAQAQEVAPGGNLPIAEPPVADVVPPTESEIQVKYVVGEETHTASRTALGTGNLLKSHDPVVVRGEMPNEIEIELNLPMSFAEEEKPLLAPMIRDEKNPGLVVGVPMSNLEYENGDSKSVAKFKLFWLGSFYPKDKDTSGTLSFDLYRAGVQQPVATIEFTLRAIPQSNE